MVNKKGYIRTLEAVIAIILILIFVFSVAPKRQISEPKTPREIQLISERILNEVGSNKDFRQCIIEGTYQGQSKDGEDCINDFINENNLINKQIMDYRILVCDPGTICQEPLGLPTTTSVYTKSIVISSTLTKFNLKIVKLYIWRKV